MHALPFFLRFKLDTKMSFNSEFPTRVAIETLDGFSGANNKRITSNRLRAASSAYSNHTNLKAMQEIRTQALLSDNIGRCASSPLLCISVYFFPRLIPALPPLESECFSRSLYFVLTEETSPQGISCWRRWGGRARARAWARTSGASKSRCQSSSRGTGWGCEHHQ